MRRELHLGPCCFLNLVQPHCLSAMLFERRHHGLPEASDVRYLSCGWHLIPLPSARTSGSASSRSEAPTCHPSVERYVSREAPCYHTLHSASPWGSAAIVDDCTRCASSTRHARLRIASVPWPYPPSRCNPLP